MKKDAIIVGGGIGGLCSGIRLQNKGYNVILLEKNKKLEVKSILLKIITSSLI